jgi:RNA polymerase sigma factor (sigma-70 family)
VTRQIEDLLRDLVPGVIGVLVRHYGDLETCEDAVQEALLAAATQWPVGGVPANPAAWLVTVASRRRVELWRSDTARRHRERAASATPQPPAGSAIDDTLTLLVLCCHPSLTPVSQVALTLRAVGGLSTAEIARAFLVPESTIGQRISRAKRQLKDQEFRLPPREQLPDRVAAVLHVLYLIFNEGYTASSGPALTRVDLSAEAIRLARQLHAWLPEDGEVAGLLALMLLTDARRPARTGPHGELVPLAVQDRSLWSARVIAEGVALVTSALGAAPIGPYQVQAAIAAVHDEAPSAAETDWPQILALYGLLDALAPGPLVTLSRIVALAMVEGAVAGLTALDAAAGELAGHYRADAVRAHLLDLAGDHALARTYYELAARRTLSLPERGYLEARARRA